MAIGKNKRISKGRKGGKKKVVDAFAKKEWYLVKAPSTFVTRNVCNTIVSKTAGTRLASDSLKGRICEVNLGDLQRDDSHAHRKVKLIIEDVQGKNCLTDFHGMSITRDYLCSLIRKWHTLIEAVTDVKTLDGYVLRMSCIGFTKRHPTQQKATCYAQTSQVRAIRQRMVKIMTEESNRCILRELVKKLIPEAVGKQIEKSCERIFPLEHVCIRKVKVVKKPKTDMARLMELHADVVTEDIQKQEATDAQNVLTAEVSAW